MFRNLKSHFCLLALLAMAYAQVFGVYQGYQYEIGGVLMQTSADHHHEGDGIDADHFAAYIPHVHGHDEHNGQDEEHEGAPKPNTPNKIELNATQSSVAMPVPAVAVLEISELPDFLSLGILLVNELCHLPLPSVWDEGLSPPACLVVTDCTVLLV